MLMLHEEKVFKDPVHNYIHVQDRTIWNLINTKEFQRLRRIRQLGTSYFTFHGAEHSRFSHSLGVYEITRRIISQFEQNKYVDWSQEDRLLALCAALLHDVGHGPFSHSIEEAVHIFHEEWTCRIITGNSDIHAILSHISPEFPFKVAAVIQKNYPYPIVVDLIAGALDADRMDYLLRDAYFTGVNYGAFDIDRILRLLRPYKERIVVKDSGMHAVEHYLLARYEMYCQVYFHPVTRSSEMLLRHIFMRARELYLQGYSFRFFLSPLEALFTDTMTVEGYLQMDEAFMQTIFMQWVREKDERLAQLCRRFMERNLYKYVETELLRPEQKKQLQEQWVRAGLDPHYDLIFDSFHDYPYNLYGKEGAKQQILLWNTDNIVTELSEKSAIINAMSKIKYSKNYIYFPMDRVAKKKYLFSAETRKRILT